ncbi:MAG TPA: hypothetical protein VF577_05795 [Allosphingosinicella sp.]
MSIFAALLLAILPASPAPAVNIEVNVGRFDPADFPEVVRLDRRMPEAEMVTRVEAMLSDGRCTIAGAHDRRFNIVVPFAILMEADGTPDTVVVHEAGCVALETLVGQIVLAQLARGDFRPQHAQGDRWYVSELGFAMGVQSEAVALARDNVDRVICREEEQAIGSRVRIVRACKTAAEWVQYDSDREQLRRDIQNAARCGNRRCGFEGITNGRN